MTISTKIKNNLIDVGIVVVIAFISYFLLSRLSLLLLELGRILIIARSTSLRAFFPSVSIGLLQGYITAKLIRNRSLFVAIIPAISLFVFAILYFSFSPYFSLSIFWREPYVIITWLLLIISSFLSARWALKRREKTSTNKMNKRQKITLIGTLTLVVLFSISKPTINWKMPRTSEEKEIIIREEKRLDKIYFIYGPFSIISLGGILIYIFRNKKQKS